MSKRQRAELVEAEVLLVSSGGGGTGGTGAAGVDGAAGAPGPALGRVQAAFLYICVYVCICVYICVFMCIFMYICVYLCIFAYIMLQYLYCLRSLFRSCSCKETESSLEHLDIRRRPLRRKYF